MQIVRVSQTKTLQTASTIQTVATQTQFAIQTVKLQTWVKTQTSALHSHEQGRQVQQLDEATVLHSPQLL